MLCPNCGSKLEDVGSGYFCNKCMMSFTESEAIHVSCPLCGKEISHFENDYWCYSCNCPISSDDAVLSHKPSQSSYSSFESEPDYESMINNGDAICLNCTYWGPSPYGASYGMVCRRGHSTSGPGDSCFDFAQSRSFASYGDNGQYQFDETSRDIANKLYHWRNNR